MDIDLYLRITQQYPWRDLAAQEVILFHLEHYPHNDRSRPPRKMNPTRVPSSFATGNASWGHPALDLPIVATGPAPESAVPAGPPTTARAIPPDPEFWHGLSDDRTAVCLQRAAQSLPTRKRRFPWRGLRRKSPDSLDRAAAAALAWHVTRFPVNVFVDFGCAFPEATAIVVQEAPACAVYMACCAPDATLSDLDPFVHILRAGNHRGQAQFVGGDATNLLTRLWSIIGVGQWVDLAFAHLEGPHSTCSTEAQVLEVIPHLSSQGTLVVSAATPGRIEGVLRAVARAFPARQVRIGRKVGLVAGPVPGAKG